MISYLRKRLNNHFASKLAKDTIFLPRVFDEDFGLHSLDDIMNRYDADNIFIVHGLAYNQDGMAVVVTGPAGCGKTTNMNRYGKEPIDDAIVLIIKRDDDYYVLETGMLCISESFSKNMNRLRKYNLLNGSDNRILRNLSEYMDSLINFLVSAHMKITTKDMSDRVHVPKVYPIKNYFYIVDKHDFRRPRDIKNKKLIEHKKIADMMKHKAIELSKDDISDAFESMKN